jgi:leucyl-tRNA synthetase
MVPVSEDQCHVQLNPTWKFKPLGTLASPLETVAEFVNVTCPSCGGPARRDCDVMDNFLDSAWYFFRYISAQDDTQALTRTVWPKWFALDMYIGGQWHAVLHLMYTLFIPWLSGHGDHRFREPFKKFRATVCSFATARR